MAVSDIKSINTIFTGRNILVRGFPWKQGSNSTSCNFFFYRKYLCNFLFFKLKFSLECTSFLSSIISFHYLLLIFTGLLFYSCKNKSAKEEENVFYTCSMDPQIMEKKPGNCPICKMVLTKTVIVPNTDKNSVKLSDTQIKLGNIKTTAVKVNNLASPHIFKGAVVSNPSKREVISARVSGRITRLYFKTTGKKIHKGEKIFDLYSEELEAAIKQYLMLKDKAAYIKPDNINYREMMLSAKDKLVVWGLSNNQINHLKGNVSYSTIPFYSSKEGVIDEIPVHEGDYVNEGATLLTTADYTTVWVAAEVYARDIGYITAGTAVEIIIEGMEEEKRKGTVVMESPEYVENNIFSLVYIEVENRDGLIKPGMRAIVSVSSAEEGINSIPRTSVMTEQGINVVWIANKGGEFTPRKVQLGKSNKDLVQVISGIKEGELIVSSGVYLLNSEYHLRNGHITLGDKDPEKIQEQKHQH